MDPGDDRPTEHEGAPILQIGVIESSLKSSLTGLQRMLLVTRALDGALELVQCRRVSWHCQDKRNTSCSRFIEMSVICEFS